MSLEHEDAEAAAVAVAPRVTLDSMKAKIAAEYVFTGDQAAAAIGAPVHQALGLLTVCILVMDNGYTLIGKSAPASPENFNAALGAKIAREDAIRQLWPLEGYALRERLSQVLA